jgi:hypothetical protein
MASRLTMLLPVLSSFACQPFLLHNRRVPNTFLSTSHEYNRIADYGDERIVHAWAEVFKMLSPSPIIRVGGASQDKMTQVSVLCQQLHRYNACCLTCTLLGAQAVAFMDDAPT